MFPLFPTYYNPTEDANGQGFAQDNAPVSRRRRGGKKPRRSHHSRAHQRNLYDDRKRKRQQKDQLQNCQNRFFSDQVHEQVGYGYTDEGHLIESPVPSEQNNPGPVPQRRLSSGLNGSNPTTDFAAHYDTPRVYFPVPNDNPTVYEPTQNANPPVYALTQNETPSFYMSTQDENPSFYMPTQNENPSFYMPTQNENPSFYMPTQDENPSFYMPTQDENPSFYMSTQNETPAVYMPTQDDDNSPVERSKRHLPVSTQCNFEVIHRKPCLRLIASQTSSIELSDPMSCVFDEKNRYWIAADRKEGIVFISEDIQRILKAHTYCGLHGPTALVLLDRGDYIGILDELGILTLEVATGRFTRIVTMHNARGLGMTPQGDFVTIDSNRQLCFIHYSVNFNDISRYVLVRTNQKNFEGQPSQPSFLNVSARYIVVADYALGRVYSYKYDGVNRILEPQPIVDVNCIPGVSQSRLTGIYLDDRDRILVTNNKENVVSLFDSNGIFLQRIPIEGYFCRSKGLFINRAAQVIVFDVSSQPHRVALYQLQADPSIITSQHQLVSRHTQCGRVIAYIDLEKDEEIKSEVVEDSAVGSSLATSSSLTSTVSSPARSPFSVESEAEIRPITNEFRYNFAFDRHKTFT